MITVLYWKSCAGCGYCRLTMKTHTEGFELAFVAAFILTRLHFGSSEAQLLLDAF